MGHPMAKKSFRFRGEKVLKNRKNNHCESSNEDENDAKGKYSTMYNNIQDEEEV